MLRHHPDQESIESLTIELRGDDELWHGNQFTIQNSQVTDAPSAMGLGATETLVGAKAMSSVCDV